MAHNLFKDLDGVDISSRYTRRNKEFEKELKIEEFELEIDILDEEEKNKTWAEYVISFHDNRLVENKDILSKVKNLDKLYVMKKRAEDILQREVERVEIERRKAELDAIEHARFVKAQNIKTAMEIDEEILRLATSERNRLWCEKIEKLDEKIDSAPSDVIALVNYNDRLS